MSNFFEAQEKVRAAGKKLRDLVIMAVLRLWWMVRFTVYMCWRMRDAKRAALSFAWYNADVSWDALVVQEHWALGPNKLDDLPCPYDAVDEEISCW